ncbi:MAG: hypothetical protein RLZZ282_777 [Verrucomicrobiota bacterium]
MHSTSLIRHTRFAFAGLFWGTLLLLEPGVASGQVVINEVLAYNRNTAVNPDYCPDFVELRNNGNAEVDLSNYFLSDDVAAPNKYKIPANTKIAANRYLLVCCDSEKSQSFLHTGFGLNSEGDQIQLLNGATLVDSLAFGPQAPDVSLGRIVDGTGTWQANTPTPKNTNTAKTLGAVSNLRVNEWMAKPAYGDDWFEIYNADSNPVALAGLYLSDNPTNLKLTQIPPLSFIAGKGCARFWADDLIGGSHCSFKLSDKSDNIMLTASNGTTPLDTISFSTQVIDVSQGWLPDGGETKVAFTSQSASPGYGNWATATVCINEVLANAGSHFEDAIELHNPTGSAVNIGGWWLSDDVFNRKKYQIPAGTIVQAGGYKVIYAKQMELNGAQPFVLSALGDEVILSAVDNSGALTGYSSFVRFGTAAENVSFGRVAATGLNASSGGAEFWPQSAHTFGKDNPASGEDFRTGTGATNASPKIGPVTINEIMFHPVDLLNNAIPPVLADNTRDEFVEISNLTNSAQNLGGWRLKGDTEFIFPANTSLSAYGYLLVVSFNPTDAVTLAAFRSAYGLAANVPVLGPYSQKLSNSTGSVEIAYPTTVASTSTFINMDKVEYRDILPWPIATDGNGQSLQRLSSSRIGNTAANWGGATPTPGAKNAGADALTQLRWDEVPTKVYANHPFAVRLTVRDLDGLVVNTLNGNVTATSTPPTLTPASLTLTKGEFIGYVALNQVASTTLTANDGGGNSVTSPPITVLDGTDSDGDGMPDVWETTNELSVGTNDAALDKDGDGIGNAAEWIAGTKPLSASSRLTITSSILDAAKSSFTISFPGVGGKLYRICTSPDLKAWTPVPPWIFPVTGGLQTVTLPASGNHGFVRVEIVPSF